MDKKDNPTRADWGTIFSAGREHTLGGIEHARSTAWTKDDEEAYLARVKEKAAQMASSILEEAKTQAESIRQGAREEGYNQGIADAQAELDAFQSGMADSVNAVLSAIEGQCSQIFSQWRDDLTAVARLAVEKVTAVEISERGAAVLEALLDEAVALLETRRSIVIRVNPEDEPVIADIVNAAKNKFPDIQSWRVKADAGISPGGLVLESESSLAEGRVESRKAAVEEVLRHLTLPGMP